MTNLCPRLHPMDAAFGLYLAVTGTELVVDRFSLKNNLFVHKHKHNTNYGGTYSGPWAS